MPNHKLPSDRLKEAIEPFLNEEDKTENEMFKELCQITDDQHSEIQSLRKEVEELKKERHREKCLLTHNGQFCFKCD